MCACVQAEKDQEEMLRQAARLKGKKSVEVAAAAATSTFANATLYDREEGTKLIAKIRKDKKEGQYDQDARLAVECFKTLNAYKPLRQFFKELVADSNEARGAGTGANKTKSEAFDDIARRNKGKVMSLLNFQHFLKLYRIVPFLITSTQATEFFYRANPGHANSAGSPGTSTWIAWPSGWTSRACRASRSRTPSASPAAPRTSCCASVGEAAASCCGGLRRTCARTATRPCGAKPACWRRLRTRTFRIPA